MSLRTKGILAVLVLLGYLALIAVFLSQERRGLMAIAQEMAACEQAVRALEPATMELAHALVEGQALQAIDANLESLNLALEDVQGRFPAVRDDVERFRRAVGSVKAAPSTQHVANMRDAGQALLLRLQRVLKSYQGRGSALEGQYRAKQQFIGVFAISANVVGAVASVAVILVFFTRLARDIKSLQSRAVEIVQGYDGAPLPNGRRDEVGGLIDAVNRMQVDLRESQRQVEVARQQRFHQEKMAAVGSLASAIGHEVSNPIAAISGVAQFIAEESAEDERPQGRQIHEFSREILKQTERISHIMRQLASLTAPRSPEAELINLNALVRSTCGFIRYDKRFRGIEFEEGLDPSLPAVTAVADHVTQILMNLLINAADACEGLGGERCRIRVATRLAGDEAQLLVTDCGKGMTPEVMARAFDESFTTKPAGRGRGIGLFICKSLIEKAGGRIELSSVPDRGTTATVHIPLKPAGKPS